ncbi:hypothetical protein I7I51_02901 [Histoplasma capsulatum]|uniref:Uncharacterized protein n=1 Tax=Ajellomyces capsulatus TaxID=5037 RepID=A0A8A1MPX2_AJECA|nr:predicted protein [Histoplasma mississippiense (nom. inval.)]EDN11398.1 predicted protein [Histoplasma mississippiense (nom. inval.)]QSS66692.1 hypothetical protein I7I51_02901 [Histoplasma capsulatum]
MALINRIASHVIEELDSKIAFAEHLKTIKESLENTQDKFLDGICDDDHDDVIPAYEELEDSQYEILELIEKTEFAMFETEAALHDLFTDNNVDSSVKTEISYCVKRYQAYLSKCDKEYVETHGSYTAGTEEENRADAEQ